jgi:8-oxo-dGTP pyrophosphatase MutT (NUDIX family)
MIDSRINRLRDCLSGILPGRKAQELMAPSVRPAGEARYDGSDPMESGVMILLFPSPEGLSTVFIHRTPGGPHGGQISLPGGRSEKSDLNLVETAIRETHEEIGVDPSGIVALGCLTPLYVPHSNYVIQPVAGYLRYEPVFNPDGNEVEEVIPVSLDRLFDPGNHKTMILRREGFEIAAPYYEACGYRIWGATAMIMSEFERIFTSCISG